MSKLNIATYNIWKNDGDFPKRIFNFKTKLENTDIDIFCFQEDYNSDEFSSSSTLNDTLNYNCISTKTRQKTRDGVLSSSNLTTLSRFKTKLLKVYYLDKDDKEERACQILETYLEDKKIITINTHLCHFSEDRRLYIVYKVLEFLDNITYDMALFCGDLNSKPTSKVLKILSEYGFDSQNTKITHERGETIDYILYKTDLEVKVNSEIAFKEYSDHYCLVNSFEF